MSRPFDLAGAAAIVTGAGSGIGRASALSFARRGARIVVADLRADRAQQVATEIEGAGGRAIAVTTDVAKESDLVALREACLAEYGRVDVVMNNVGVVVMGAPESLPDEAWVERTWPRRSCAIARNPFCARKSICPSHASAFNGHP